MKTNLILVCFAIPVLASSPRAEAQAPSPAAAVPAKTVLTNTDLRKLIENTEWVTGKDESYHVFFHRDGIITGGGISGRNYAVEAPDILKIYRTDPAKDRKAEFNVFRLNVAAMIAELDAQASPKAKGGKLLKYIGPAPKKYVRPDPKKK